MRLMDSAVRLQRLIRLGIVVAGTLLTAAAVLLALRKGQLDQLELEYAAARQASVLVEQYAENGAVDELPATVTGFAVYDSSGSALVALGTAPQTLHLQAAVEEIGHTGSRLRLVRPIGGGPSGGAAGAMRGIRRAGGETLTPRPGGSYALLDYDTSSSLGRRRLENAALIGSGSLTAVVLVLIGLLFNRLRRAQQAQQDQARLAQLGDAARTLAHEIRNPLTAAQIQSALLRRSIDADQHGRLDVLDEELARIKTLTEQVREFIQSGAGRPAELDPVAIATSLAERASYPVRVAGPERPVRVVMDPDRFRSVMTNLMDNAADAMRESGGGEISEPVLVTIRRRRDGVEIEVADRGPGISPRDRERVFDPFFTTKAHGSGVGLSASQRFVEEAGGSIAAGSRDGGGARMTVRLKGANNESADRR